MVVSSSVYRGNWVPPPPPIMGEYKVATLPFCESKYKIRIKKLKLELEKLELEKIRIKLERTGERDDSF